MGSRNEKRRARRAYRRGLGRRCAGNSRPNTRLQVRRLRGAHHDRRSQAARSDPTVRERRHRHAGQGSRSHRGNRRRRRDDRARRAGPAVDLPRSRGAARRKSCATDAARRRSWCYHARPFARPVRLLRGGGRGQDRAQTHRMVLRRSRRGGGFSSIGDAGVVGIDATRTGARVFRRTHWTRRPRQPPESARRIEGRCPWRHARRPGRVAMPCAPRH
jgi:hypothetical protein